MLYFDDDLGSTAVLMPKGDLFFASLLYGLGAGVGLLAATQVLSVREVEKRHWVAAAAFAQLSIVALLNVFTLSAGDLELWVLVIMGAPLSLLAPSLWIYFDDITADQSTPWRRSDLLHFSLPGAICLTALAAAMGFLPGAVPPSQPSTASGADINTFGETVLALERIALIVFGTAYLARAIRRLALHDDRLKQVFSTIDRRQLEWVKILGCLLLANFLLTSLYFITGWPGSDIVFATLGLAFTWVMAVSVLRQKPAFEIEAPKLDEGASVRLRVPAGRYEKSLLPEEKLNAIAEKIEANFERDQSYLDPNLSLRKLSIALHVDENKLSQTFSRKLNRNFFDYVNAWRITFAKDLLLNTKDSVTDIALAAGFNSRSAFYRAFRAETGLTPSEYKQSPRPFFELSES